jgi:hypothetical protein
MAPNQLTVLACTLAIASRIPAQGISTQELDLLKSSLAK